MSMSRGINLVGYALIGVASGYLPFAILNGGSQSLTDYYNFLLPPPSFTPGCPGCDYPTFGLAPLWLMIIVGVLGGMIVKKWWGALLGGILLGPIAIYIYYAYIF